MDYPQMQPPLPPPPPPSLYTQGGVNIKSLQQIIITASGNMKFVGIFSIIYGVITCLGCISAVIGIPLIFAGLRLKEAADLFLTYGESNNPAILSEAIEKQNRYFFIQKIIIIIGLVFFAIYIVAIIILLITGNLSKINY